ncbi:hypothetical protein SDC9_201142 [bioreactor metagenome]|uniref:Uncharacterized protein n=1 Tax=bioreactor metagenome TaxID=1076179 RepID=A0A645IQ44_9ZZZZ
MPGVRVVLRDLVVLHRMVDGLVVLGAVQHTGLQGRVDVAEGHRGRDRTHGLDHRNLRIRLLYPDLQTLQIGRTGNRVLAVVHVAGAGVDAGEDGDRLAVLER